jgi:sortase A
MNSLRNQRKYRITLTRSLPRWTPHFFFIVGILALGFVAVTLLDARLFQVDAAHRFEQAQHERQAQKSASGNTANPDLQIPSVRLSQQNHPALEGGRALPTSRAWGRIEISSIGLSSMILEGVDRKTLQRGVGHIPGTALPGVPGNVALAGHRDTFFRALRNIRTGDEITLETLDETYHYRVDLTQVVAPGYTEVLNDSNDQVLTLVTCYPFSFIGPAPQRYVVRASRVPE